MTLNYSYCHHQWAPRIASGSRIRSLYAIYYIYKESQSRQSSTVFMPQALKKHAIFRIFRIAWEGLGKCTDFVLGRLFPQFLKYLFGRNRYGRPLLGLWCLVPVPRLQVNLVHRLRAGSAHAPSPPPVARNQMRVPVLVQRSRAPERAPRPPGPWPGHRSGISCAHISARYVVRSIM